MKSMLRTGALSTSLLPSGSGRRVRTLMSAFSNSAARSPLTPRSRYAIVVHWALLPVYSMSSCAQSSRSLSPMCALIILVTYCSSDWRSSSLGSLTTLSASGSPMT